MIEIYEHQYDANDPSNFQCRTLRWSSWEAYKNALMFHSQPVENITFPSIPRNAKFELLGECLDKAYCRLTGQFYHPLLGIIINHYAEVVKVIKGEEASI